MTIEERVEFLMKSTESHNQQLGEITDKLNKLSAEVRSLSAEVKSVSASVRDLAILGKQLVEVALRHDHRISDLEGGRA